ncbi:uncharacterized protein LOC132728231 [Ruditapes philippinarum]|uniref:uncharacterized protein LOC132728231 n=1 Tax=Ruditapes philippinarum TaxID=129788 RepID=UPI00295C2F9E|nr:uncharacterized protein LOC132728231 [Ruditapes philippinarum]
MNSGDFLICATILTSGNNFGKLSLWAQMLQLKFPSASQFSRIQTHYLVPAIDSYWERHQEEVLSTCEGDVVVLGDGRNDSPGHCAQYCSYSLMDNASKQILTIQTIDKRMTGRKSAAMEKLGFQAAMNELKSKEVTVKEVVTDAHLGIGALMKTPDYDKIQHSHDIWHAAKNLGKKITKIAMKKGNRVLGPWIKDIVNHFWFTCKQAETKQQFTPVYRVRNYLAAIDHNKHVDRPKAVKKDGTVR